MIQTQRVKNRRISKPQHIKQVLVEQINILRQDSTLETIERARAIGYLSNIVLTSLKDGELEERLARLEEAIKRG